MTGYILKTFIDRVEIASDGAVYEPDGTLISIGSKVRSSDDIPLAIVGSGPVPIIEMLAEIILRAARVTGSVDDTMKLVAGALEAAGQQKAFDSPVRMAIGAISETRGPTTYMFTTFVEHGAAEPFKLCEKPRGFGQGQLPDGPELLTLGLTLLSLDHDAPILFDYMRRQKSRNPICPERAPFHSIGGHLDLTIVRADGYEQRVLKTWPDRIGEKIDPFGDDALKLAS